MSTSQKYKTNNKRIAKNTFYLYLRMLMVMVVTLFTVRIVLNALGAEDYGINNVVGGFVSMFAFLTSILNSASLRFFSFNIGKNDQRSLSEYFTMSFWCFALMAIFIFILAESIGLWFVKTQLTIPDNRLSAALWVFHFSIVTFVLQILVVPYNSIVIAHERMNIFALVGVIECILKLVVAYFIYISPFDKLKTYTVLLFATVAVIDMCYFYYGLRNFPECRVKRFWSTKIFLEIAKFSGWSLFGAISGVVRGQGINMLINIFFNPMVNAARAIAFQINANINQFVANFYKAVQPQINKSYGAGDLASMHSLVFRSSRLCFYLIFIISMPVLLETEFILSVWLKNVPEHTVLFTRLVIITAIIDSTSYPLQTSISATGRIKLFQLVTGGLLILNLPVAWLFLRNGYPAESTMYVAMAISFIAQLTRIYFAKIYTDLHILAYVKSVILPIILVTIISYIIPLALIFLYEDGVIRFISTTILSVASCLVVIFLLGIDEQERKYILGLLKQKLYVLRSN